MGWSVSILLFAAVTTFAALILAMVAGTLTLSVSCFALLIGALAGLLGYRATRAVKTGEAPPGLFEKIMLGFFALFCLRQFLWAYFHKGGDILTLNRYPYADLHFHLAFIKNFANGAAFWPENPLYSGGKLAYHFGADLFSAVFLKLGAPLTGILPLTGLIAGLILMFALFIWARGFGVGAFLFAGGTAGFIFLATWVLEDYQANLAWKSLPLTLLLPQRGYLYAFPAGLIVLWSWRRRFLEDREGLPAWVEGTLWGLMPLFQIQSFGFLALIFAVWTVGRRKWREALPVYYWAVIPATFLVLWLTDFFGKAESMLWIKPGWMVEDENPFVFFLVNFGLYIPLVLVLLVRSVLRRDRNALFILLPATSLFLFLMFVMFGPWEWDNIKFLAWCFLLVLPVIQAQCLEKSRLWIRALLVIVLFFSGAVCVLSAMGRENKGVRLIEQKERDAVCHALRGIPNGEHFASAQAAYHPVLQCGHRLAVGYNGVLSAAFGLDGPAHEDKLQRLMMGEHTWRVNASRLSARYLFWGPREAKRWKDSNRPWEAESLRIAGGEWGALYDLHEPAPWKEPVAVGELPDGAGLEAVYYGNEHWKGDPVKTGSLSAIHFDWQADRRPVSGRFSLRLRGQLRIPESGPVTLFLASDDGSELRLDGERVIDNQGVHSLRVRQTVLDLEAGWHDLEFLFMDVGGGATGRLWWRLPSGKEEAIGPEFFRTQESSAS